MKITNHIAMTPKEAYYQAFEEGSSAKTRSVACRVPSWAYHYAMDIDRGPNLLTRVCASKDPRIAFLYARDVDKGPHSRTRAGTDANPLWEAYYKQRFDDGVNNQWLFTPESATLLPTTGALHPEPEETTMSDSTLKTIGTRNFSAARRGATMAGANQANSAFFAIIQAVMKKNGMDELANHPMFEHAAKLLIPNLILGLSASMPNTDVFDHEEKVGAFADLALTYQYSSGANDLLEAVLPYGRLMLEAVASGSGDLSKRVLELADSSESPDSFLQDVLNLEGLQKMGGQQKQSGQSKEATG